MTCALRQEPSSKEYSRRSPSPSSESVPTRFTLPFDPQRVLTRCWWDWPFLVQVDVGGRHNEKPLSSRYFRTIFPSKAPFSAAPTPPSPRAPLRSRALWPVRSGCASTHSPSNAGAGEPPPASPPRRTPPQEPVPVAWRSTSSPRRASPPCIVSSVQLCAEGSQEPRRRRAPRSPARSTGRGRGLCSSASVRCRRRFEPYSIPGPRGEGLGRAVAPCFSGGDSARPPSVSRLPRLSIRCVVMVASSDYIFEILSVAISSPVADALLRRSASLEHNRASISAQQQFSPRGFLCPNFSELRKAEVQRRRILLLGHRVNRALRA